MANSGARRIEAIIFDFGGVFTRTEVSDAKFEQWDRVLGYQPGTIRNVLHRGDAWEAASTGRITPDAYWAQVGAPLEAGLPPEFGRLQTGVFLIEPIDEEMVRLTSRLRDKTRLALCSNAMHDLEQVLMTRPDIRELFEVVIVSVTAGVRKPDPAILALTASNLGIAPDRCLLIDDKARNTKAARAMGMQALQFRSTVRLRRDLERLGLLAPE